MMDKTIGDEKTVSGGLEEIQSIGDVLTQRQRKRFKAGDVLLGRYRILGELGQGGMGLVFRCLDEIGGIEVAVKMLPPEVSHDSGEMEDVRENFALVASLVHQNICAVRTLEKDPATGEYFLVMELAQGVNLRQWRKGRALSPKAPGSEGSMGRALSPKAPGSGSERGGLGQPALPLEQILPIVRQIAAALDYAHEHKVIHRDIKPSNVMVQPSAYSLQSSVSSPSVKVLDFGLAAQIHTSFSRVSHVRYGTSGTGPYMAPEQWEGQYQDAATDQYALAVLTYELLTGHCPFESHEATVLRESVLRSEPRCPPGLPAATWAVLKRGLAKEREERFRSCGEFAAALGGEKILPQRTQRAQRGGTTDGHRWTRMVAGLVVLAGVIWGGIWGWRSIQESGFRSQNGTDGAGTPSSRDYAGGGGDPAGTAGPTGTGYSGSPVGPGDDRAGTDDGGSGGPALPEQPPDGGDGESKSPLRYGWVDVRSEPAGAAIWVGTNEYRAGQEFRLPVGEHEAVARLSGHYDATVKLSVSETRIEKKDAVLSPHRGSVKLSSTPSRARIWLEGRDLGLVTLEIVTNLLVGKQVFTLKKDGYRDATVEAVVTVDDMVEARAVLDEQQGWLRVMAKGLPEGAEGTLTVGGKTFRKAKLPGNTPALKPGSVRVRFATASGLSAEMDSTIVDGQTNTVTLLFQTTPDLQSPYKNSLGMELVPVSGLDGVLFCKWETRVQDFRAFAEDRGNNKGYNYQSGEQPYVLKSDGWKQRGWEYGWSNPGFTQGADHPVTCVSWNDAVAFCEWLTEKERREGRIGPDQRYRLPKDWEWSVAVGLNESRSGSPKDKDEKTPNVYPWGSGEKPPTKWGNYAGEESRIADTPSGWNVISGYNDGFPRTSPVGHFGRKHGELCDMGGNVWEWCDDFYDGRSGSRVLRGGSWNGSDSGILLSSYRGSRDPVLRLDGYGFRVVLSR